MRSALLNNPLRLARQRKFITAPFSTSTNHFQTIQIWGANTDVGKTVFSAGLLRAGNNPSFFIKPVQTGYPDQDDSRLVQEQAKKAKVYSLFTYGDPVSPDLAARLSDKDPISNSQLVSRVSTTLNHLQVETIQSLRANPNLQQSSILALVETAGGVLSPAPCGTPQADVYRPLRLQSVLLGDPSLGGISATLAAYEAMLSRGYDIPALVFLPRHDHKLENAQSVEAQIQSTSTTVFCAPPLPKPERPLSDYYLDPAVDLFFRSMLEHLRVVESERLNKLASLPDLAKSKFWYPFTQYTQLDRILTIDSAHMDNYAVHTPETGTRPMFDAAGSWWTNGVGHGHPRVMRAIAAAAGRYGHVIFPEAVHEPAAELTTRLLDGPGEGWASRVFYSDNGSTAMEVALKMAFRKRAVDVPDRAQLPFVIIGMEDCYHGDTLGVMDCCPSNDFNSMQSPWYVSRGYFFEPPKISIRNGIWMIEPTSWMNKSQEVVFQSKDDIFKDDRADDYRSYIADKLNILLSTKEVDIGALVIEPVFLGAGGMHMIDPAFQRVLVQECRARKVPIVFDEIFTGLWRLGVQSAAELLGCTPDIAAYGKLMTGGTVPLSATLATEDVKKVFDGESKKEALLHGHSYTAHPIGCAAGVESLRLYDELVRDAGRKYWSEDYGRELSSLNNVEKVTVLGTVLSVQLVADGSGYAATGAKSVANKLAEQGIAARPLGNVIYMMCTPLTETTDCDRVMQSLMKVLVSGEESAVASS